MTITPRALPVDMNMFRATLEAPHAHRSRRRSPGERPDPGPLGFAYFAARVGGCHVGTGASLQASNEESRVPICKSFFFFFVLVNKSDENS